MKGRPKWATNVAKVMERTCPSICSRRYAGIEKDTDGNVTRIFSCENHCDWKRRGR